MSQGYDQPDSAGGNAFHEWFLRHQRVIALLCVAGVLASIGIVAGFLASDRSEGPVTPFAGPAKAGIVPVDDRKNPGSPTPETTTTTSPSPSATASPSAEGSGSPSASPSRRPSVPVPPTREPGPDGPPTTPPPTGGGNPQPTQPTTTPTPPRERHAVEIEVTGERTFVAVVDENGRPFIARRMRAGERFAIGNEDYLRIFVEKRAQVRIVVDGQVREGDPNGRFDLVVD